MYIYIYIFFRWFDQVMELQKRCSKFCTFGIEIYD